MSEIDDGRGVSSMFSRCCPCMYFRTTGNDDINACGNNDVGPIDSHKLTKLQTTASGTEIDENGNERIKINYVPVHPKDLENLKNNPPELSDGSTNGGNQLQDEIEFTPYSLEEAVEMLNTMPEIYDEAITDVGQHIMDKEMSDSSSTDENTEVQVTEGNGSNGTVPSSSGSSKLKHGISKFFENIKLKLTAKSKSESKVEKTKTSSDPKAKSESYMMKCDGSRLANYRTPSVELISQGDVFSNYDTDTKPAIYMDEKEVLTAAEVSSTEIFPKESISSTELIGEISDKESTSTMQSNRYVITESKSDKKISSSVESDKEVLFVTSSDESAKAVLFISSSVESDKEVLFVTSSDESAKAVLFISSSVESEKEVFVEPKIENTKLKDIQLETILTPDFKTTSFVKFEKEIALDVDSEEEIASALVPKLEVTLGIELEKEIASAMESDRGLDTVQYEDFVNKFVAKFAQQIWREAFAELLKEVGNCVSPVKGNEFCKNSFDNDLLNIAVYRCVNNCIVQARKELESEASANYCLNWCLQHIQEEPWTENF